MFVEVRGNYNEQFSCIEYPGKMKAPTVVAEELEEENKREGGGNKKGIMKINMHTSPAILPTARAAQEPWH